MQGQLGAAPDDCHGGIRIQRRSRGIATAGLLLAIGGALGLTLAAGGAAPEIAASRDTGAHECRFWGLIGTGYPDTLIADQLQCGSVANLRDLAGANRDGWAIGFCAEPATPLPALRPILRRGGPAANDPGEPDFDLTVAELSDLRPPCAMAHVRNGTSGHLGIPDPHPFLARCMGRDLLFAHNGGLSEDDLAAELEKYIETHPLDYVEGNGDTGPIDSELFFVYLRRFIEEHPDLGLAEALPVAMAELVANTGIVGSAPHLNFLLSDGDTLFALHYYEGSDNPVRYAPAGQSASPFWVVASEPLGSSAAWGTIPPRQLAIFVPGEMPAFVPIPSLALAPRGPARSPQAGDGSGAVRSGAAASTAARATPPQHNCRFWALVGQGYPADLIESHLQSGAYENLRALGGRNIDGWALGYRMPPIAVLPLSLAVVRRGGPRAPLDEDYPLAVAEMREIAPHAAVGHVRAGTSGHRGIPNPHPFEHQGMLFAHNGTIPSEGTLEGRLGDYLDDHAPDYTYGLPSTGPIDSELYFLYLLKLAAEAAAAHPDSVLTFLDGLVAGLHAISQDVEVTGPGPKLNFVMTRGDTLYALHYYEPGSYNPVRYYPGDRGGASASSSFWVAASEQLGATPAGWAEIPARTLAMFVPGETPRFVPLGGPGLYFTSVAVEGSVDADEDGWFAQFEVRCDPDVAADSAYVSAEVWGREAAGNWFPIATAPPRWISPFETDTITIACVVDSVDAALAATHWDLKVTLRAGGSDSTSATSETHPDAGLADFPVESALRDETSDLPREFAFSAVARSSECDDDGDGYVSRFELCIDVDYSIPGDSARTDLRVIAAHEMTYFEIARTGESWTIGGAQNRFRLPIVITPEDEPAAEWDFALGLYDLETEEQLLRLWWHEHESLAGVPVEGRLLDTAGWAGTVRPNPGGAGESSQLTIPLLVPELGATVAAEIYDLSGRLIWSEGPATREGGEQEIVWDGRDRQGRRVASGIYFVALRVAARSWTRRIVLTR